MTQSIENKTITVQLNQFIFLAISLYRMNHRPIITANIVNQVAFTYSYHRSCKKNIILLKNVNTAYNAIYGDA